MIRTSDFRPPWWLANPHLQTLWSTLFRRRAPRPAYVRERLELADGDFLDLDWCGEGGGPLVLILHGLEGSAGSPYARGLTAMVAARGWRAVVMHFRGCSGVPNRLPRSYHSGETGDLETVVGLLRERHPGTPLAVVGYSLGGNVLLKWLGERGGAAGIAAAAAVSVPFLLDQAATRMSRGLSRLYQRLLLHSLRRSLAVKLTRLEARVVDPALLPELTDFWRFDDAVTAPLHGFRDVHDYYRRASSRQYLAGIRVPTLLLHALDDPFMTPAVVPTAAELSSCTELELSAHGGHVGFVTARMPWRPRYWSEERIATFLAPRLEEQPPQPASS